MTKLEKLAEGPARHRNYFLARTRDAEAEEVPWLRIPGLRTLNLPRPVVLINGAFDVLHSGHLKLISAARDKAATLVCALDSDRKVKESKGSGRPILSWIERATALGFTPIDVLVEIDSDKDMKALVTAIRPDLRVQSSEYREIPSKFPKIRKMFVLDRGIHTSEIIERIQQGRSGPK